MNLKDALGLAFANRQLAGDPVRVFLACGFTPLHLPAYLAAHLSQSGAQFRAEVLTGTYGDLCIAAEEMADVGSDAAIVIVEYADLDPRFGLRRSGSWSREALSDAVASSRLRLDRLRVAIQRFAKRVAVVLPTLPLPPIFATGDWQAPQAELELKSLVASFAATLSLAPNIAICREEHLAAQTVPQARRDARAELAADFPYSLQHASAVARTSTIALFPKASLKAVITDLDDTLWRGLVGEIGHANVTWSLDGQSQIHALYQQTLQSLADLGILIGIASKNDPAVVQQALRRDDLLMSASHIFPVEANWLPKSESIRRILRVWNIGADAVVFVDDNPIEIAEVSANFPKMRTMLFPTRNDAEALRMLGDLRNLFHRESVTPEDSIRINSLRNAQEAQTTAERAVSQDDFLQTLGSHLSVAFAVTPGDSRPLELINKTNQFNLNGRRLNDAQWTHALASPDSFVALVSYSDKFGPLGRISVAFGHRSDKSLLVDGWVLSCRAFSRRIEHAVIQALFDKFPVNSIVLAFSATDTNGPARDFLASMALETGSGHMVIERTSYVDRAPRTYHTVSVEA